MYLHQQHIKKLYLQQRIKCPKNLIGSTREKKRKKKEITQEQKEKHITTPKTQHNLISNTTFHKSRKLICKNKKITRNTPYKLHNPNSLNFKEQEKMKSEVPGA